MTSPVDVAWSRDQPGMNDDVINFRPLSICSSSEEVHYSIVLWAYTLLYVLQISRSHCSHSVTNLLCKPRPYHTHHLQLKVEEREMEEVEVGEMEGEPG